MGALARFVAVLGWLATTIPLLIEQWWILAISVTLIAAGVAIAPWGLQHAQHVRATREAPSASVAGPPLLHLLYSDDKFHVYNERTNAYLELWGTQLGDGSSPRVIGPKKEISPGAPYDLFVSPTLKANMLRNVHPGQSLSVPLILYLKSDGAKYVARFTLVMHNIQGVISIDTQLDAVEREDWLDDSPPRPTSNSGIPTATADAHLAHLANQLFAFLARRRGYHPNGLIAGAWLETGTAAQLMSRFFASEEWWNRAVAYDAETLQQYLSHYAKSVREVRDAIVNPHAPPDPTMDALILDQPRQVVEIASIATYLRTLAGIEEPKSAPKAPSTTATSAQDAMAAKLTELVGEQRARLKDRAWALSLEIANMQGDYPWHKFQVEQRDDPEYGPADPLMVQALSDEAVKVAQDYRESDLDNRIHTFVADCKRIGVEDPGLDAVLATVRPMNRLVTMEQLADVGNRLALFPGKIDKAP
jgi:hypothetical protein